MGAGDIDVRLNFADHQLIMRALAMAASRLESQARSNPRGRRCSTHEQNAAQMRTLRARLGREQAAARDVAADPVEASLDEIGAALRAAGIAS